MKVVGFSFIKNAVQFEYPIVEALQSILPLCDEVVVAVPTAKPPISQPLIGTPERPMLRTSGMLIRRKSQLDAESPVHKPAKRCIPA